MRYYELLFVLKPVLTEEEVGAKVAFIQEVINKNGGEIAFINSMGVKKLAYTVEKFERGHYFSIMFKSPANAILELERNIRINEDFIKFLTVKFEKRKEITHWEKTVSKLSNKNKEATPSTPSEANVEA